MTVFDIELEVAIEASKQAGELLLEKFGKIKNIDFKTAKDIVTDADLAAEKLIISMIKESFPDHNILAEESGTENNQSDYLWVIDPLDGTVNYVHGIPIFGVSIALQYKGEIVCGVINIPKFNEIYSAQKGGGAFCNGEKISVNSVSDLSKILYYYNDFNIGKGEEIQKFNSQRLEFVEKFSPKVMRLRCIGSAAVELALIASGKIDAYTMIKFGYWDVAAGKVLVEEAGGKVTALDGSPLTQNSETFLATNNLLHDIILQNNRVI